MKHKATSYLNHCEEDIKTICNELYSTPEESYKEQYASSLISSILKKHNFIVEKDILDIKNSFYAYKGTGHPKICFLCEYDAIPNKGHITGHNLLSSISVLAGLSLGNAVADMEYGSSIIIGCPGEYLGGTKNLMAKQGLFDDIDVVMVVHPQTKTIESGTSSAIIPLSISFSKEDGLSFLNEEKYNSLDAILLTFNIINTLAKGFDDGVEIHSILSKGGETPLLIPKTSEGKFYIRAKNTKTAEICESKIKLVAKTVGDLMNIESKTSLYEPPNEELLTNSTLNRLLNNNLKEAGIINILPSIGTKAGLSIGTISKIVPTIHSYICITDDEKTSYGSTDFADATITPFAFEQCKKAGISLALTGLDLIINKTLLHETKTEFYNNKSL